MSHLNRLLAAAFAAFFIVSSAFAQNSGTVTNHAFAVGKGAGTTGYTSLLCGAGQIPLGQSAADPVCTTLGTMGLQNATAVAILGGTITGLPSPSLGSDAATKSYVDSTASGLNILAPSTLATAAVLPNTPTYANGTAGVGATLTAGSNTTLTVDGTAAPLNTVVLVKNQASAFQNGVYTVTQAGSGSVPWILTRATYFDQAAEMKGGSYTFITTGSANINSSYVLQSAITTVGTDSLNWALFASGAVAVQSLGGANGILTLGSCLSIPGNTLTLCLGIDTNTLRSVTSGPDSIVSTDCGKTVQEGTGTSGLWTITLPVISGFDTKCQITIINGDSGRGKRLSGFCSNLTSPNILWPTQQIRLKIVNGVWVCSDPGRWVLQAAAGSPAPNSSNTYTINIGGSGSSDTNDGLATGTGAFATPQAAINAAALYFDLHGQNLVFQIADGTYTQAGSIHLFSLVGQTVLGNHTEVIIRGNVGTLGNVTLAATGSNQPTIQTVGLYPPWRIEGIKFQSTSSLCVSADGQSFLYLGTNQYDVCAGGHINASYNSFVEVFPPYTVSAGAPFHINNGGKSEVLLGGGTITLAGTPNFTTSYFINNNLSYIEMPGTNNYSGTATGPRLNCGANSIFQTFGFGIGSIPGNSNGSQGSGCIIQ